MGERKDEDETVLTIALIASLICIIVTIVVFFIRAETGWVEEKKSYESIEVLQNGLSLELEDRVVVWNYYTITAYKSEDDLDEAVYDIKDGLYKNIKLYMSKKTLKRVSKEYAELSGKTFTVN